MLSANKPPPLPLGLEIVDGADRQVWESVLPDQRPVRYMAPLLGYLFPSIVDLYRRGRTIYHVRLEEFLPSNSRYHIDFFGARVPISLMSLREQTTTSPFSHECPSITRLRVKARECSRPS